MDKQHNTERLQPSLLDRLRDDEPKNKTESRDRGVLTDKKLRESVLRDIRWLLNSTCFETSEEELRNCPNVRTSSVNYGIRDFAGSTASIRNKTDLQVSIEEAIINFEPRIIPHTLKVNLLDKTEEAPVYELNHYDEHRRPNIVVLKIEGDLWAQHIPERLYLKTVLDLELGNIEIRTDGG